MNNQKAKFSVIYTAIQTIVVMVVLSSALVADGIKDVSMFIAVLIGCAITFPVCWGINYIYTSVTNWILERTSK